MRVRLLADMRFPSRRGVMAVPLGARLSARVQILGPEAQERRVELQVRHRGWHTVAKARTGARGVAMPSRAHR